MPEEVKPNSGIALGFQLDYKLGPSKNMHASTFVGKDDSIEDINAAIDKVAQVIGRQQAIVELDAFYDELRIETKRLNDAKAALEKAHKEYKENKESFKNDWDKKHDDSLKTFQDNWGASGRKGDYKLQPQHQSALKNIDTSYQEKLSQLEMRYQADTSNHTVNIRTLQERLEDTNRSISKREAIVNGYKKPLKLVNEG